MRTVWVVLGFPGGSMVKNLPANAVDAGDKGLIPGSRRSFWPRDRTWVFCVFCTGRQILYHGATWESRHLTFIGAYYIHYSNSSDPSKKLREYIQLLFPYYKMRIKRNRKIIWPQLASSKSWDLKTVCLYPVWVPWPPAKLGVNDPLWLAVARISESS